MSEAEPPFKALMDAVIAQGHTCQSVLRRLDARIARTPPGPGLANLVAFRRALVEKISSAAPPDDRRDR